MPCALRQARSDILAFFGYVCRARASVLIESEPKLQLLVLTRFLHANRYPRRSKRSGHLLMTIDPPNEAAAISYAYKASLVGSAHRFELTDEGLSWRIAGKSGVWPYAAISGVRLSYRPVSMQSRRFRADIDGADRGRIALLSTSWQTSVLISPQDQDYRVFIVALHRRMAEAGSNAVLTGGLKPRSLHCGAWADGIGRGRDGGIAGPRHPDRRTRRHPVSDRLRRAVRLAGRRLCLAQPAADVTRSIICPRRCCHRPWRGGGLAIKRNEN